MDSKFFAPSAIAFMLAFGIVGVSFGTGNAYAQSDTWYVGEGVQQDMYLKYRIQEFDTQNGDAYDLTLYFQEQDEDGNWIVPTFVEYRGQVYEGTLKLGNNMASLGGGSVISDDLRPFIGGYGRSLQWLEAFTPESRPLSLSQPSWGKIAAIGGAEIKPMGKEQITTNAGTFDTTVIGWHKGVDNKIWVMDNFPYPIKAQTYVEVASGQPPTQFAFTLEEMGTGQPESPQSQQRIPTPPLERDTGRGTYSVSLDWEPASIEPNSTVTFAVGFSDNNDFPLNRVSYDFTVTNANGEVIYEKKDGFANDFTGFEEVEFGDGGPITISVVVNSVSGQTTGAFTEQVDFSLVVVPEFPVSAVVIAGAVIGFVALMTRFYGTSFGSMFGRGNAL